MIKQDSSIFEKNHRVIRMRELRTKLPLSESHFFALIQRGQFPKPFALIPGGRAVGWFEADVDAWIRERATGASANCGGDSAPATQYKNKTPACKADAKEHTK